MEPNEREVFLITLANTEEEEIEIILCESLAEANDALSNESSGNIEENTIKIYHGVLIPSTFIPNSFNGCTPHIVVFSKNELQYNDLSDIVDSEIKTVYFKKISIKDSNTVSNTIMKFIKNKAERDNEKIDINFIKLFLGHEVQPVLNIPDEHIDEELIERVIKVAEKLNSQNELFKEGKYGKS